jgi:hypothetical protein
MQTKIMHEIDRKDSGMKHLESELARYRREAEDAYTYLQGGLVELGVSLFIL